ncbi:MAG TPA: DUF5615 family PIN-like protein [Thermoanaerobaculia bacterium]
MRIKVDENLPLSLVEVLKAFGHDADHVVTEGLSGRDDTAVWGAVKSEDRFLITQDIRFANAHPPAGAAHSGVLLIRMQNAGSGELSRVVRSLFAEHDVEQWRGCLVVVSERKLRIRRP